MLATMAGLLQQASQGFLSFLGQAQQFPGSSPTNFWFIQVNSCPFENRLNLNIRLMQAMVIEVLAATKIHSVLTCTALAQQTALIATYERRHLSSRTACCSCAGMRQT